MTLEPSRNYTLPRSSGAKWMRSVVFVIACLAVVILLYPYWGEYLFSASDKIPWQSDLDQALAQARLSGKPVLLDFSASWCPPCQEMKRKSWPQPQVGQVVTRDYIPVIMDVDSPAAQAAAQKYGVEYIPALFIVDGEGKVIRRGSFMSTEELLKFLSKDSPPG